MDDEVLLKIHTSFDRGHTDVPALDGPRKCCDVGYNYAGTIVQIGNGVTEDFKEGNHVAVSTCGAAPVGIKTGCLNDGCTGKGNGYYNKWRRVVITWPSQ